MKNFTRNAYPGSNILNVKVVLSYTSVWQSTILVAFFGCIYLQFILRATECLTGVETLLFWAWQVSRTPLSVRFNSLRITLEVTVDPDETSELEDNGSPDQNQRTRGLGRPKTKEIFHFNRSLSLSDFCVPSTVGIERLFELSVKT